MTDSKLYPVDPALAVSAWVDESTYEAMYRQSIEDPDTFWAEQAKRLDWIQFPTKIKNTSFAPGDIDIRWYEDGILNVSYNCLDRHLRVVTIKQRSFGKITIKRAEKVTIETCTSVCRFANGLRAQGVKRVMLSLSTCQ